MKISRRVVSALLVGAIVLFVGMLFWPFIFNKIIQPIALVLWLLLRILVLSIHQKYFWYGLICIAFVVLIRLLPREPSSSPPDRFPDTNAAIHKIGYWHSLFTFTDQNIQEEKTLRHELIHLLSSLYASKQRTANNFSVYEALEQGRIPLPETIHTFLFPQEPQRSAGPIEQFFQSIRKAPPQWIRQWTGQEKAEHFQRIEEVLHFMETSLEIKHDDRTLSQNEH
jgi:hypothetical protein